MIGSMKANKNELLNPNLNLNLKLIEILRLHFASLLFINECSVNLFKLLKSLDI